MTNISFYRKYRPTNFDDVVGQKKVVTVLKNSVINDMVRHAYIFSGPRGTGKTSLAKLFARKINCKCSDNSCDLCSNFSREFSDIWEIDAASNNSVNNIRDLIEDAMYLPLELSKKVYIIDEVHMLSNSAFNALLKTLEEPPSHVVFILATTELNKILPTVLSRCVKLEFDFISQNDIRSRLEHVCQKENISYEIEALDVISSLSGGGLRDSLSLFETVYSSHKDITLDNTIEALNIAKSDFCEELFLAMKFKNLDEIKKSITFLTTQGINYSKFCNQYIKYLKEIMKNSVIEDKRIIANWLSDLVDLLDKLSYTKNQGLMFEIKIINTSINSDDFSSIDNHDEEKTPSYEILPPPSADQELEETQQESLIDMLEISKENPVVQNDYEENKLVLYDVLTDATKKDKELLKSKYDEIKNIAEREKLFSIAKFFELSAVSAACNFGCVISIDDEMYTLYSKKISEIKSFICKNIVNIKKVFIYSNSQWKEKRDEFIKKPSIDNDKLILAEKIFGKEHVKKI